MGFFIILGFLLYITIAIIIAIFVPGWKYKALVLLIFVLIPTWDIPLGLWELNRLCNKEGGQFIYEKVALSEEYFLKAGEYNGQTGKPAKGGELDYGRLVEDYKLDLSIQASDISSICLIDRRESIISAIETGEVLGKATGFLLEGCWFKNWAVSNFAPPSVSKFCPEESEPGKSEPYFFNIEKKIFLKK